MSRLRPPGADVPASLERIAAVTWLEGKGLVPLPDKRRENLSVEITPMTAALEYARLRWALEATRDPPFAVQVWAPPWVDVVLKAMRGHALFSSRADGATTLARERSQMSLKANWCAGLLDDFARALKRRPELPHALAAVKSATAVGGRGLVMCEFLVAQGVWSIASTTLDEGRWHKAQRFARTTPPP